MKTKTKIILGILAAVIVLGFFFNVVYYALIILIILALAVGIGIFVAQYIWDKDNSILWRLLLETLWCGFIFGIIGGVIAMTVEYIQKL